MRSRNPIKSLARSPKKIPCKSHANHREIITKYCKSHEIPNSATGENSVSRMRFSPSGPQWTLTAMMNP